MTSRTIQVAFLCSTFCVVSTGVAISDDVPPSDGFVREIKKLHTGFAYTEGPAVDAHGNVYFSDIPNNRIHKIDAEGRLSTFLEDSGACNGLMFDAQGRLLACQGKSKRLIAIDTKTKKITSLADRCDGKDLGTPNDLVIDRTGGVYFTAPDTESVFYVDAKSIVSRLPVKTSQPNGVKLSPDEKTFYVLPSGTGKVMAYPVVAPGKLGVGKVFCNLVPNPKNPGRPGGDGLAVDTKGNLYLTRPSIKLIQVVTADGATLRLIHLPQEPSNCTFGGADMKTLYVTAQTSLYALKVEATGHRFAALPRDPLPQESNVWIKRSPLATAPPSPRMGYETSLAYDPIARRVIRWAGHAQGGFKGSGEQTSELWILDPTTMNWEHKEPNRSPPPVCCAAQQVFDTAQNRFLRIRSATGNHGWQWFRGVYLNNSSMWSYDLATNTWRDMRPLPEPVVGGPMHCASWDSDRELVVAFGGEGSQDGVYIYDPYTNTWERRQHKIHPLSPRSGGNLAYDAARKVHILFGSQFGDDPHTWAYDLAKDEWRDLKPTVQPPTLRNDAVLDYDSANRMIVAVVRTGQTEEKGEAVGGRLETWAFDAGKNTWTQMNPKREPDGHGNRSRVITYLPDQNLFLLESCINPAQRVPGVDREQQIWTYRFAEAKPAAVPQPKIRTQPRIVEDAVVSVISAKEVRLSWKPPAGHADIIGYHVEGAVVEPFSEDEVLRLKKDTPPLAEPSVGAIKAIGSFQRLTRDPVKGGRFTDDAIDLNQVRSVEGEPLFRHRFRADQLDAKGKPYRLGVYAYRIRAVDSKGVESGPSPYFLTIPSAPQNLFSKEEGDACRLKWSANPEQGIRGYRIYWMKGPRPEGPGQATNRLTPDPVADAHFVDGQAGKDVRRYWVVAVDALGQEGIPSSPTWHYRTQRSVYVPFVGEWHQ